MKIILQVEDDPNDVFFLQHAMNKAGVANPIQVVSDGRLAIDYLQGVGKFANRDRFPLPCLILLDLKLPYVMGLDVLRWIRQKSGLDLVVVLLTASAEDADIATAYRLGANGFLVKPSQAGKLDEMVRSIRDFWLTHNVQPREASPVPLRNPINNQAAPCRNGSSKQRTGASKTHREEWRHPTEATL
jgi:CheY-like chemotaxis protein